MELLELLFAILFNVMIVFLIIAFGLLAIANLVAIKYYYLKATEEEKKGNDKNGNNI